MNNSINPARLIVTSGEPAGIGPDILIQLAHQQILRNVVIVADPDLLKTRARLIGIDCHIVEYSPGGEISASNKNQLNVLPIPTNASVKAGELNPENAKYVLKLLNTACDHCLEGLFDALVTGPLSKSVINNAGIEFTGHTEYLAQRCRKATPVMLLSCPQLKVALVTTHLPLSQVSSNITPERLQNTLKVIWTDFINRFAIDNPEILVCGLNPHAGEGGYLGDEELTIIEPVIKELNQQGLNLYGPVSADTAFSEANRERFDVFVCMYHDQGLPVLKTLGFDNAVNVTLGLPIIRTSVDHGTALPLAGSGTANVSSLQAAINMAVEIVNNTKILKKANSTHEC